MKRRIIAVGALALIILVSVMAVVGCSSSPAVKPASTVVKPTPPDPYTVWYGNGAGTGYTDFQAVQTDIDQLNTDASNQDVSGMSVDATQLATDANTALQDPMPLDTAKYPADITGDYITMMGAWKQAGQDIAAGNYNQSVTLLDLGSSLANNITSALNNAGGQ